MRSIILVAMFFSVFSVFADKGVVVDLDEVCKSFIGERDVFKAELDQCKADLAKLQEDVTEEEVPAIDAEAVEKTAKVEEKVLASKAPARVKKEVTAKAEAVYKSYVREDGQTLKKYAELQKVLDGYVSGLKKLEEEVDFRISKLENKVTINSAGIIVLREENKIQDKEIAAVAKKVENSRIKFEIFLNGGYTTVEKGLIDFGVGTLIPVGKNRTIDIELAVFAGIATSSEMGTIGFLVATPFVIKEWKKVTLSLVPEANFLMTMDILGNSGSDTLEAQKGKIFSYSANGAIGIKALFGEYWFLNAKLVLGYAYVINPNNYKEKNSLNVGFSVGGGVQF